MTRPVLRKIGIAFGLSFLALAYLYLSSPNGVVITATGKADGLINNGREILQGNRFWSDQQSQARREIEDLKAQPQHDAELARELKSMHQDHAKFMEDHYRDNPESRPSSSAKRAEELRDEADRVEHLDWDRQMEKYRLEKIEELVAIIRFADMRSRGH